MWLYIIQLKLKQIEQSRPGIWVSVIWPLEEDATYTLPRPQGTHAGQLPANTPIYCDTLQTLNYIQKLP